MPPVSPERLRALDVEYARFNAEKTLADSRPSDFKVDTIGPLTVTRDPRRRGTYYNRILGCGAGALPWLDRALRFFDERAIGPRIDVDKPELSSIAPALAERDFCSGEELIWLVASPTRQEPSVPVRKLTTAETGRIPALLELQGPVDMDVWALRQHVHCTERFRVFVIDEGDEIGAMATTFVGEHGVMLGNAFTREECRGRGYHRALIAARLSDACDLGVEWVATDVEPDTTSLRNCERSGFRPVIHQTLWEPDRKTDT